jgi:hypothetical protein
VTNDDRLAPLLSESLREATKAHLKALDHWAYEVLSKHPLLSLLPPPPTRWQRLRAWWYEHRLRIHRGPCDDYCTHGSEWE